MQAITDSLRVAAFVGQWLPFNDQVLAVIFKGAH
jgi:hypothetical protein